MNDWKCAITLTTCCGMCLTIAASASADFVGVTTVIKDDPDTAFLCTEGNGKFVPGPLTVCNVFAAFDDPTDRLLWVGDADLQVYNGAKPDVFFQHPFNFHDVAPLCSQLPALPDLICDSFVTIGIECEPACLPIVGCSISTDFDWDSDAFNFNGHAIGGWSSIYPSNGQGDAGTWPDLQVFFLRSSVSQGLSMSGDIDIFWVDGETGETIAEVDVPIECAAGCPDDYPCDDGDACTENDQCIDGVCTGRLIGCDDFNPCTDDDCDPDTGCTHTPNNSPCDDGDACTDGDQCGEDGCVHGTPIDCNDGNECTDDLCDPDTGCTHQDIECPDGQVCEPASGRCVEAADPCECAKGSVTLCHVPPGNPGNARTITVGCAARDRHLAHGDTCGPCE